ncbi:MAG: hypothetical protein WC765_05865 [Phycisphaerae bacterium]
MAFTLGYESALFQNYYLFTVGTDCAEHPDIDSPAHANDRCGETRQSDWLGNYIRIRPSSDFDCVSVEFTKIGNDTIDHINIFGFHWSTCHAKLLFSIHPPNPSDELFHVPFDYFRTFRSGVFNSFQKAVQQGSSHQQLSGRVVVESSP